MIKSNTKNMKTISSEELIKTPIFTVTMDHALDPDGFEIKRAIVQHEGSAVIMPVDDKRRVLLVRQYRLPAKRYLWELPAGRVDPGESPLKAAKRELTEETGYRARTFKKLAEFWPSPGFLAEKMTIYLATDLTAGEQKPMEDERIQIRWFTSKEIDELIGSGKIQDAKTNIGFLRWKRYWKG
jgi:ADP-ribose pyrophosphatase